jgi:GT2 family glycosyltransferase
MKLSVIVSTYERPAELAAVLAGLRAQADRDFELVVSEDGSSAEIKALVETRREQFVDGVIHVGQPDEGYRLALARNRAALASTGDYLVFMDGDCVPRRGFVAALRRAALPDWFVAGRRVELGRRLSGRVLDERLQVGGWSAGQLALRGTRPLLALTARDRRLVGRDGVSEFEPHANAYGFLLGLSRADFERANGFDARFVDWGEEDVDLAVRLRRLRLRCGHAGPQATLLHLSHPSSKPVGERNVSLLAETKASSRSEAVEGLRELAQSRA